jgi:thioredoxin 1
MNKSTINNLGNHMNAVFLTAILATGVFYSSLIMAETKKQKIEQLFELTNDRQMYAKVYEPMFTSTNITDEKIKKDAIDTFFVNLKQDYVKIYDKTFTETDIDEMLKYYRSTTGQRVRATAIDIGTEMGKAYANVMTTMQDLLASAEKTVGNAVDKVASMVKSTTVVHFDDIAKSKSDDEIRTLFNKIIQHDGLTIVKFSSLRCPPCKAYAPIFDAVAAQLKELSVNGKKISVKYVAIDIDAVPVIASDCGITSIPTTLFYKNGKKVDSKVGSITKDVLNTRIQELAK